MSTANLLNTQFEDSEDEEDFNPAPADLSDDENADEDDAPIRRDIKRPGGGSDGDEKPPKSNGKSKPSNLVDENGEDDEGEGEDIAGAEDDEEEDDEEDEDDEEEEVTVSHRLSEAT